MLCLVMMEPNSLLLASRQLSEFHFIALKSPTTSSSFTQLSSHDLTSDETSSPKRRSASLEPQHVTFSDDHNGANYSGRGNVERGGAAVEGVFKNNVKFDYTTFYVDRNDSVEDILSFDVDNQSVCRRLPCYIVTQSLSKVALS